MAVEDLVHLDELWKIYPIGPEGLAALQSINLTIPTGQYVAIMGASGSGKSTLLNVLGCLDGPTRGRYHLAGQDVSAMTDDQLSGVRNLKIGFVFQSFNLIQWLSVVANIEVPLFYQGVARSSRHPRSRELAELVGLGDRIDHLPRELSGGEQQRVAIARSLANDPLILLADEPTGNLDTRTGEGILALFDQVHARGRTIVVVTHETHVADRAQRVIQLCDGRVESDETR
ncbi:MAG: ABC transporter ATP-binding protein [Phycisphaerae bacterium]|nr:ABC transporter ATP-binding protein [Phycisphaerae bacterium]